MWTDWTSCGITCGNQWGKRYRSQKCDLTEDEQISELCKGVYFLQVEPEWCFGKGKCPGQYMPKFNIATTISILLNHTKVARNLHNS